MTVSVLVVDDEPLAAQNLASKIRKIAPTVEVEILCNPFDALTRLKERPPEILFLDIKMPELSGFELLAQLADDERQFALVFCTAYAEFALDAFEAAALDYIVKPADPAHVERALTRSMNAKKGVWSDALEDSSVALPLSKLTVKSKGQWTCLDVDRIAYIASETHETVVYTADRLDFFCDLSLGTLEIRLPSARFFRCHRSYLVNLAFIDHFDLQQSKVALCTPESPKVPVSRRARAALKERLDSRLR